MHKLVLCNIKNLENKFTGNLFMLFLNFQTILSSYVLSGFAQIISKDMLLFLFIHQLVLFIIPMFLYKNMTKTSFKDILPFKKIKIKNLIYVVSITFFMTIIASFISMLTSIYAKNYFSNTVSYLISNSGLLKSIFVIALTPAIAEEFAFRGVLLHAYRRGYSKKTIIFITGLFFGLIHLNISQFFYAMFLGFFLSYFVLETGSIFYSMLSHFIINTTSVILSFYASKQSLKTNEIDFEDFLSNSYYEPPNIDHVLLFVLLLLIILPFFLKLLSSFSKYNKENNLKLDEIPDNKKYHPYDFIFFSNIIFFLISIFFS